jgi:FOG: PAS/PAC domain
VTGSPVTTSLLARALGEVSDGTLISNAAGTVIYANTAFTRITGYEPSEIVGKDLGFLHGPSTSSAEVQRMRDALDAAEVFQGTLLDYRKDGTSFWNHLTITPLKDAAGASPMS